MLSTPVVSQPRELVAYKGPDGNWDLISHLINIVTGYIRRLASVLQDDGNPPPLSLHFSLPIAISLSSQALLVYTPPFRITYNPVGGRTTSTLLLPWTLDWRILLPVVSAPIHIRVGLQGRFFFC